MSKGLGKIERAILEMCAKLERFEDLNIELSMYRGGYRNLNTGNNRKLEGFEKELAKAYKSDIESDNTIIDLREINWHLGAHQPSKSRAIKSLKKKGYLKKVWPESERFVRLNIEKKEDK